MSPYEKYVARTEVYINRIIKGEAQPWKNASLPLLNGQPWYELRRTVDIKKLRKIGAFFTSHRLARLAIDMPHLQGLNPERVIATDPACGAGDLLLPIARHFEVKPTLFETLQHWGTQLGGFDRSPVFIRLAKLRLVLLALHRGALANSDDMLDLSAIFPGIKCGDGLLAYKEIRQAELIVLNPPFFLKRAEDNCSWGTGRITSAAHFVDQTVTQAQEGARIIAILPDVLRTGTSYQRWREHIEENVTVDSVRPLGIFDNDADVHVFILSMTKKALGQSAKGEWWRTVGKKPKQKVEDYFNVHVGAVVPHRHRKVGKAYPYIHARSIPRWSRVEKIAELRRFQGTTFQTPFVVIRRTSRPEDRFRAVGTLITQPGQVAVENHLIVCSPKDATIKSCMKLLRILKDARTSTFLNERIRCRHLTVSAIRGVSFEMS